MSPMDEERRRPMAPVPSVAAGVAMAVVSATCYGFNITAARLAYDGAANPPAVIQFRYLLALVLLPSLLLLLKRSFRPPATLRWPLLRLAFGNFGVTLGYVSSILFIPVSLAAIIFYTYPLMVLAVAALAHGARLGPRRLFAFGLAFIGLVLTLGPSLAVLDPRGIGLALLAAVSAAYVFTVSPRIVGEFSVLGTSLYTNCIGASLAFVLATLMGGYQLPESATGWLGLSGVTVFYVTALLLMYLALRAAGSLRCSLVYNLEPVIAILGAALILGERLSGLQVAGVVLVIGALTLVSLSRRRG